MLLRQLLLTAAMSVVFVAPAMAATGKTDAKQVVANYSAIAFATYHDALMGAKHLQKAVDALLGDPSQQTLDAARKAWVAARLPYLQTEAYRFYGGPIDFTDEATGAEGPEGQLNAWPLNEAYIDYVKGNDKAGIINNSDQPITIELLRDKNQSDDEADVSTGYHAIEFLLWGQDFSTDAPGDRAYTDYVAGDKANDRRRTYLKLSTALLVDQLQFLADSWKGGQDNYAKQFNGADSKESLAKLLTGLATLSGFELASERMATALDSGDQEDEHSCFSDTTHNDFLYNARGVSNVYFGRYGSVHGASLYELLRDADAELSEKLSARINITENLMQKLPHPIDREILASPKDSAGRKAMEAAIASLQDQAELLKQAGKALGVDVKIVTN